MRFSLSAVLGTLLSTTTAVVVFSSNTPLKEIEVHFYDKNSSDDKKIRLSLDSLGKTDSFYVYEQSTWKPFNSISSEEQPMYKAMFGIASKYIQTQNNLNIIKTSLQNDDDDSLSKYNCCQQAGGQCNCSKSGTQCCAMCIGCYADGQSPQNCCNNSGNCLWTEFKKLQNTFKDLFKRVYSGYYGIYLSPVQAHIKFPDITFDELKSNSKSTSSSSTEYKSFIGTLTYGFVDYWFNPTKYKSGILSHDKSSEKYITLNDNDEKIYFTNIPQKFTFPYKIKKDETSEVPSDEIENILKQVKEPEKTIRKYEKQSSNVQDCCTSSSDLLACLLKRNFIYKIKENEPISEKMKKVTDCCAVTK